MYPLNMKLAVGVGFAVANGVDEHKVLSQAGYLPAYVESDDDAAPITVADDPAEPARRGPGRPRKDS